MTGCAGYSRGTGMPVFFDSPENTVCRKRDDALYREYGDCLAVDYSVFRKGRNAFLTGRVFSFVHDRHAA